jgi:hypothetical protein
MTTSPGDGSHSHRLASKPQPFMRSRPGSSKRAAGDTRTLIQIEDLDTGNALALETGHPRKGCGGPAVGIRRSCIQTPSFRDSPGPIYLCQACHSWTTLPGVKIRGVTRARNGQLPVVAWPRSSPERPVNRTRSAQSRLGLDMGQRLPAGHLVINRASLLHRLGPFFGSGRSLTLPTACVPRSRLSTPVLSGRGRPAAPP